MVRWPGVVARDLFAKQATLKVVRGFESHSCRTGEGEMKPKRLCPVCHLPMRRYMRDGTEIWKCMNIKVHVRAERDLRGARPGQSSGRAGNQPPGRKKKGNGNEGGGGAR